MTWTRFMDMHSGGGQKLDWGRIYIEAPEAEAQVVFQNRFGRNPDRVTCTCCGPDYSSSESATLEEASAYDRKLRYVEDERGWHYGKKDEFPDYKDGRYLEPGEPIPEGMRLSELSKIGRDGDGITVDEMLSRTAPRDSLFDSGPVLVIRAADIKPEERVGELRPEGYVWAGSDDD